GDEQSSSGGMDTLVFNSGDSIDFSLDHSDILNFEAIDLSSDVDTELAGAHSLKSITLQDVLDITDTGNDLRVFGDNADTVTLMNEVVIRGLTQEQLQKAQLHLLFIRVVVVLI
ncbi:MAG: hypothetical protein KAR12_08475, partial [Methylococcales bacterium]|nr:hypothetical protein [Methylococcales bacterium]